MAASPGLSLLWPVTFVTGNFNKMDEVKEIFGNSIPYQLLLRDLPEMQGDPLYICRKKAAVADAWVRGPVIVEVTSLCFNALNGLPGRYVKWFLKKNHPEGLNNILMAYEDKSAYALSVVAMVLEPDTEPIIFHGKTMGKIVAARGNNGFGWDVIFQPDGSELTYAEMSKEEKNRISHRSISLSMAKSYLAGARYVLTSRE